MTGGYSMRYGSEPDIEFSRTVGDESTIVGTIEIKGGKDPAGALERLGAIQKSFEATPPGCVNMLIAGIITSEMRDRLNRLGIGKTFLLDDLAHDGDPWAEFLNEVFHYTIRITAARITMSAKGMTCAKRCAWPQGLREAIAGAATPQCLATYEVPLRVPWHAIHSD